MEKIIKPLSLSILLIIEAFLLAQTPYVRTYGISGFTNDGVDIVALPDTTYIIAGNRVAPSGHSWAWIFKTDSLGKIIWEKYIDNYDLSIVHELRKTLDGNILIAGTALKNTTYFGYVYKINPSGQILWQYENVDTEWNEATSVCLAKNDQVYVTFAYLGNDTMDQDVVIKVLNNTTGEVIASKRLLWPNEQFPTFIDTLFDNTLSCTIVEIDTNGYSSYFFRLDEQLDSLSNIHYGNDTIQLYMNGFVIDTLNIINFYGFHQKKSMSETRFFKAKLDLNLGFPIFFLYNDFAYTMNDGVVDKTTNNIYLVGHTTNNFGFGNWDIALYVDSTGGGRSGYYGAIKRDWGYAVDVSPDNAIVLVGSTENYFNAVKSILLVKLHKTILHYDDQNYQHFTNVSAITSSNSLIYYPNPSTGSFYLQAPEQGILTCYNSQGKQLFTQIISADLTMIDLSFLPNGWYFFRLQTSRYVDHFSLLLQR